AEVLLHDDVGGGLRPRLGELHTALLEEDLAVGAADHGVAHFPLDGLERVDTLTSKEALHAEARARIFDHAAGCPLFDGGSDGDGLSEHEPSCDAANRMTAFGELQL